MACQQFRTTNFRPESLEKIERIKEIVDEYDQKLTARQVYYQFVSRGWLGNNQKNYKTLTSLLTDARYAGEVDWEVIEDRGREPSNPSEWPNLSGLVDSALSSYRLPRWEGQEYYCELWVEKQALAGVLAPIARRYHVTLMVNKGYSSASAMKESADRYIEACSGGREQGADDYPDDEPSRTPILFYLGDHDPSGEDMVRDIHDRLVEFGVGGIEVKKLALTMEQIKRFQPPPNPAKITDSRAKAYIEKYGDQSWELDALPPDELNRIVNSAFKDVIDQEKMDTVLAKEKEDKQLLREAVRSLRR